MMATILPDWLHARAKTSAHSLAFTNGQESWTFQQLDDMVARVATRLTQSGVVKGRRVALIVSGEWQAVPVIHALARIGAVLVPLNGRLKQQELAPLVADADVDLIITQDSLPSSFGTAICLENLFDKLNTYEPMPASFIDLTATQFLVYTSGTTGRPKGALLSFGNIYASAVSSAIHLGTLPQDLWLHMMPLSHIGGLSILFRSVITGSGIVWLNRFDPQTVFDLLHRYPITLISVVPTMLYRLLESDESFGSNLRIVLLGGAPAPASLVEEAHRRNVPAVQTYGLTETSSQIATRLPDDAYGTLSSGPAIYPTQIAIMTPQGPSFSPYQHGEVLVKGPTVFQGYWKQPDATQATFWNDWLRTGDIGYLDERGYLTVIDRQKELIIKGGENLSPSEIEAALLAHPHINDAGVIGVPDPQWGQVPVAIIATDQSISRDELHRWAQLHLSTVKQPTQYYQANTLPRTASGKLRRRELAAMWENGQYAPI